MLKLIVTLRADDPKKWMENHENRVESLKHVATDVCSYMDPAGSGHVGLTMTVTDQTALNEVLMSDETIQRMRNHGGAGEPKFLISV